MSSLNMPASFKAVTGLILLNFELEHTFSFYRPVDKLGGTQKPRLHRSVVFSGKALGFLSLKLNWPSLYPRNSDAHLRQLFVFAVSGIFSNSETSLLFQGPKVTIFVTKDRNKSL